ncbi:MAG: ABC transporter permease [bacterium]|nr:ABC transporter permease [bacterium]
MNVRNSGLLLIAKDNMRKSKGSTIVLFALIVVSTILIYSGLSVLTQLNGFLDQKAAQLNTSDYICSVEKKNESFLQEALSEQGDTAFVESSDVIESMTVEVQNKTKNDHVKTASVYVCPYNESQVLSKPKFVGEFETLKERSIYVPYALHATGGYEIGDMLSIQITGVEFEYEIAGFFEDMVFANVSSSGCYEFYVLNSCLEKMKGKLEQSKQRYFIQIRVKEGTDIKAYEKEVIKAYTKKAGIDAGLEGMLTETYKQGNSIFVNILMAIIMAFAVVLIVISLVIIRFSIHVEIERNMENIGSLQAIGYTTTQIRRAIILQFLFIGIIGILIGIIAALAAAGAMGNIVSVSVGLKWINKISGPVIAIATLSILSLMILVTELVVRKIKRITPLTALRSGIETHNFKKNHLPLEHGKGRVNIQVGLKGIFQNVRQNFVMMSIICLLSFAGVFAMTMYYNFNVKEEGVLNLVGIENANVQVIAEKENVGQVKEDIKKDSRVSKTTNYATEYMTVKKENMEENLLAHICDDFSTLTLDTAIKGNHPRYDNEVGMTSLLAERMGVQIGDSVTVGFGGEEKEFIIVGLTQQISNLGLGIEMTDQAAKRIVPSYELTNFYVYLKDGVSTSEYMGQLNARYANTSVVFYNNQEMLISSLESFKSAIGMLCIIFVAITIFVIVLTLLLLISLKLVKERKNYGIFKAIGYTTKQLILQIIVGFLPIILAGILAGLAAGLFLSNPLIGLMIKSVGISKINFTISPFYAIVLPCGIGVTAVVTIFLASIKIRNITPNELFHE